MKNKTTYATICILLISFAVWGQKEDRNVSADGQLKTSDTRVKLQREIRLEGNSKAEEIILNIGNNVDRFELEINSSLTTGDLKIGVYDPKGNNHGVFSVGTQLDREKWERVSGNISKSLKDPQSGSWKVSIVPTEATGTITIRTATIY